MSYEKVSQDSDSEDSIDKAVSKKNDLGHRKFQSAFRGSKGEPLFHPEPKDIGETTEPFIPKAKTSINPAIKIIPPTLNNQKDATKRDKTHKRESSVHLNPDSFFESAKLTHGNDRSHPENNNKSLPNSPKEEDRPVNSETNSELKGNVFTRNLGLWKPNNGESTIFRRLRNRSSAKLIQIDTSVSEDATHEPPTSARSTGIDTQSPKESIKLRTRRYTPNSTPISKLNQDFGKLGRASSFIAFQELRYNLFRISNPRTKARIHSQFKMSDPDMINAYLHLAEKLKIRSVYFDPELDVLNRFCLEFTAISMKTLPTGLFSRKSGDAAFRVYHYMDKRANSISTPIDDEPSEPDAPVLLIRLFLNEFRTKSDGTSTIGTNVPLLSHSNRLSLERFTAITKSVFDRRDYFYKNIDISRHRLDDLE